MPDDACLMSSTANAISCIMIVDRLFFSSFWMLSTVSANSVFSCTDVITANAKTCLPCSGVNVNEVLASLLHIVISLYLGGDALSYVSSLVCVRSRISSTSSVVTV